MLSSCTSLRLFLLFPSAARVGGWGAAAGNDQQPARGCRRGALRRGNPDNQHADAKRTRSGRDNTK